MSQYKSLIILILLLLIFIFPILGAYWLYYKGNHFIGYSNHGTLIKPYIDLTHLPLRDLQDLPIPKKPFIHHWTLLSLAYDDTDSLKKLYIMRQIRLMLGKNQDKVQRVLLFYGRSTLIARHEALIEVGPFKGSQLWLINKKDWPSNLDEFFIVDPKGQLIMVYTPPINPKHIMQDLKKLIS